MKVYIYGLHCPVADTIRYVGKSVNPRRRLKGHICAATRGETDHHTARWLRSIVGAGLRPSVVILREVAEGERWQDVERDVIASADARGWRLTNTTAGGEGLDYRDEAAKARYAAKHRRISKARALREPDAFRAVQEAAWQSWSDEDAAAERRAKIRDTYSKPEVAAKMAAIGREINARPEVKAAKASASVAAWQRPEYRERITAARNDPTFTAAQSARLKARWGDPEAREKMNGARWTPEKRAAQAEVIRQRSTPEYRAMMAEKTRAAWAKRKATA